MSDTKDHFTLWVISGIFGVTARDLYDLGFKLFGHANNVIWNVAADVFVKTSEVHKPMGDILGLLADLVIGGILGVLVGLMIKLTGPKNYILKGIGVGLIAWLLFFGVLLHNLPHTKGTAPEEPLPNILSFIGHAIFGFVTAWSYVKLANLKASESWKR